MIDAPLLTAIPRKQNEIKYMCGSLLEPLKNRGSRRSAGYHALQM
jgi:hypothetical protein